MMYCKVSTHRNNMKQDSGVPYESSSSSSSSFRQVFQILTITLLSLLLPLSFLLLARLTTAHYLVFFFDNSNNNNLFTLFLGTYPTLLHPLVAVITIAALIHSFKTSPASRSSGQPPALYACWIFLCTLQVCVGLGIEGSIRAGVVGTSSVEGYERSFLSKTLFFLGLHQTTMYWSSTVVKPVVDDTVFGKAKDERWLERVALAASFGCLWVWKLRDEVEVLVVVAEMRRVSVASSLADFVGWWLYYLTVTLGIVRVVKSVIWIIILFISKLKRVEQIAGGNEDKV